MFRHYFTDNSNSFNNTHSFNTANSYDNVRSTPVVANERSEILAWLSPLEPWVWHEDIRTRRVDQVGGWLLQTNQYRSWLGGSGGGEPDGSALFCYGGPWVGKTYISSLVVDTLCKQAVDENAAVACFYLDSGAQKDQSPAAILGSVLKQFVSGMKEIPERIVKAFRDREKVAGNQRLALSDIVELLKEISSPRYAFLCIDALDECPPGHRAQLLGSLNQILRGSPRTRIFLTGRLHIRTEVENYLAERLATLSVTPTNSDIIKFLQAKLGEDTMPEAMNEWLEKEIIRDLPDISDSFLLAPLSIQAILQEVTVNRRRQKLRAMKSGLDLGGAYEEILGRINAQGGEEERLGIAVLMWVTHSKRALKVDEICHAIATRIGSNNFNNDDIPAMSTLLSCCQGLVTIDRDTSTVRLIHPTLQEYLCNRPDLFNRAHSTIAEICLTYLNFQRVKDFSADPSPDPWSTPFLEYSSLYWGAHMREEVSELAKTLAAHILEEFDNHISANFLWNSISWEFTIRPAPNRKPFSALHCISYFGIAEVAKTLIEMNTWDVNQRDSVGMTPLIWAARYGHREVVGLLLREENIQPDQHDTGSGRTALSWAAGNGHKEVVRLFLGPRLAKPKSISHPWGKTWQAAGQLFGRRYVSPDSSDQYGKTPLLWAAKNGHNEVVKQLLERGDVNPNSLDRYGRTPLLWAARNGHEVVVERLLNRKDLNPDIPDKEYGQTPLSWAVRNGREGVVKLLLEQEGVNPDGSPESGRTPLLWAAENGHEGIVELLLRRGGVNPDIRGGEYGETPLLRASQNGHEGVVKLLLMREDVEPNTRDTKFGRTPLSWAARNGHEGVVGLLLECQGVIPDNLSKVRRTPLWLAAANGYEGILKLLLCRNDVNPDTPDTELCQTPLPQAAWNGRGGAADLGLGQKHVEPHDSSRFDRTLLLWAAQNGRERIVKLLLGRRDVSPDSLDTKFGRTPLSWAAGNGHEGVVELLLGRIDVNPNTRDTKVHRTALSWASRNGHERIVKRLLEYADASPDIAENSYGQTPLSRAAQNGHKGVVELLLGHRDVNPDTPDTKFGRTPLSWAAGNGHGGVVWLLLGRNDVNPDTQDKEFGRTPLSWAAGDGHAWVAGLLLGRREVHPDSLSKSGRTPLLWAAENGHERVVKLLLMQIKVSPNTPDAAFDQTPLAWAARNGHERVVELLLERKDIDPSSSNKSGQTPLTLAAEHGHNRIVELLRA